MRSSSSTTLKAQARLELFARQHRSHLTESEARLWSALKAQQLGVSFHRQVALAGFIVDFCAPAIKLIIEVDGAYHAHRRVSDERRDRKLRRLGFRVVRIDAALVLSDLPAAVAQVRAKL
jgi:very-short-patch-repair endonuclease